MQGTWHGPGLVHQALLAECVDRPSAGAWYRFGVFLHGLGHWSAASGCSARALELDGGLVEARLNLGWNLYLAGRVAEGYREIVLACEGAPGSAVCWMNRSIVARTLGGVGEAVEYARAAVRLAPEMPKAHLALAFALMAVGEWGEGLQEYEWRFREEIPEFASRPYPLWRGEETGHLMLEGEQGLGDSVQMLRFVGRAAERAERVSLFVHGPVYALLERCDLPANVRALPLPQPMPQGVDVWCPLFSVPLALGVEGPEWRGPYVGRASAERVADGERHVGIAWAGSQDHKHARDRDATLRDFLPLAEVPGVRLHALQVGKGQSEIGELGAYGLVRDRSPEITNMLDTAGVLDGLDLVICVDTAVGHLAGAMGLPVWVLVNAMGGDFRWGRHGETTAWYPSMRLWRRESGENWSAVIGRVAAELRTRDA